MAKQTFTTGQVLTAAQMTSLQQTAMLGGAASAKTASYTLVAADAGTAISMSNASATTITVNTALFAEGDTVQITNLGAGVCTITAGTATVNTAASLALAQYESGTLDFTSTSAAIFIKGAGAAPASGGMTLLSTTTLSGTSTTISSINQTYTNLQIVISGSVGAGLPAIRPNGSATITYAATQKNSTNSAITGGVWYFTEFGQTNNAGQITIYNYASATYRKPFFAMSGYDASGSFEAKSFHGYINTTSAITSIEINGSGDTFTGGQVLIYGVK